MKKAVTFFSVLFLVILTLGTMASMVSGLSFDNIKEKTDLTTATSLSFNGKEVTNFVKEYPKIQIDNAFGLGAKLFEGYLSQHDTSCGMECQSTMEINLVNSGVLVDAVDFYTILKDESRIKQNVRSYQFYLKTDESAFEVDDYETQCVQGKFNELNQTYEQVCSQVIVGSHTENEPLWKKYNIGDSVPAGTYTLKLEGNKKPSRSVDWVIKTTGETLSEWAVWGGETEIETYGGGVVGLNTLTVKTGIKLSPTTDIRIEEIEKFSTTAATKAYLQYENETIIETSNFISDKAIFSSILVSSENYRITVDNDGSSYLVTGTTTPGSYPFSKGDVSITGVVGLTPTWLGSVHNVTYKTETGTVTLDSPADSSTSDTSNVLFNASASVTGGAYLTNMSLWTNETGTFELKNSTEIGGDTGSGLSYDSFDAGLKTDLVSYYKLDDTDDTNALDAHGSNDGAQSGTTDGITGKIETAFDFDGNNDYVEIDSLTQAYNEMSVSMWFKADSLGTSTRQGVLSRGSDGGNNNGQWFFIPRYLGGTSDNIFRIIDGGTTHELAFTGTDITVGTWYNVIMTFNSSNYSIYLDGELKDTENPSFSSIDALTEEVYIGFTKGNPSSSTDNYFDGTIDEVGIWNKALTTGEIEELYMGGFPTSTQTWNRTITDDIIWNVQACDTDGDCGFATSNYSLSIDTTAPTIEILSPTGIETYGYNGQNITLNYSISDTNLDSCWYDYNGTNTTTPCADNSSIILETGNNNITLYANDSVGNVGSQSGNWTYKLFENSFTFENETRAGDQEDFSMNVTLGTGMDLDSVIFHYNGEEETPEIFSSGQDRIFNVTDYAIPLLQVDTNVTMFFEIALADATEINTTNQVQLVQAIFLDNCSSHTNLLFNISLFDERAKTSLLGDIEFNYKLLNVPAYGVINNLNLSFTNVSNALVCSDINLTDQNFVQSIEIRYVSDGYAPELYHIQRAAINGDTTTLNLFDLNSSASTEFKLTYQDDTFNFVEGAIVQLLRKYISEDVYEVVEAPLTSNEGVSVVHVDLDSVKYKVIVTKNGVVLDTFDNIVFKCVSELTGECEQKLLGEINPQNSVSIETLQDFSYSISEVDNTVTVTYSIPSGSPSSVNMLLEQKDQFGNTTMCNQTITSSGGSIDCDYDDTIGDSYIDLKIYKDGSPITAKSYLVPEANSIDWLGNNYIIVVILLLSLVGMAITSPEWMVINSIITLLLAGSLWLLNGTTFGIGLGMLMWLLIAAGILIFKLAKQEDR